MQRKKYIIFCLAFITILTMYFLGEYGFVLIYTPISADTFFIAGITVFVGMLATDGVNSTIKNSQKSIEKQLQYDFAKQNLPLFEIMDVNWHLVISSDSPRGHEFSPPQQCTVDDYDDYSSHGFLIDLDTKIINANIEIELKNTSNHIAYNVYGETDNPAFSGKDNILPQDSFKASFNTQIAENYQWVSFAQESVLRMSSTFNYDIHYSNLQGGRFCQTIVCSFNIYHLPKEQNSIQQYQINLFIEKFAPQKLAFDDN